MTPAPTTTTPTQNNGTAKPEPPTTVSGTAGNRNANYVDRIPAEQLLTLEAGADKFQARHIADLSGQPRGATIVLHDSGQHPSWPFTVAALLDDLPLHGWDTLSIELPAPAAGIEPQVQARIAAAVKYFSDQQQRNVVLIGFGSGAIRAAEIIRQMAAASTDKSVTPITTLIMIAPRNTLPGIELDLPKILPATEIPTLDITLDSDVQTRIDAELRRRAVLHQRTRVYRQMTLPPINNTSDAQHSGFVKRVRAWLQRDEELSIDK